MHILSSVGINKTPEGNTSELIVFYFLHQIISKAITADCPFMEKNFMNRISRLLFIGHAFNKLTSAS